MKKWWICTSVAFLTVALITNANATAISESSGSITVDWDQGNGVFNWNTSAGYFMYNSADAQSDLSNSTTFISDSPGSGFNSAEAAHGTTIVGQANTATSSVFSSGYVSNDATGFVQSASGTSHLRRGFTVATNGVYQFDVTYSFFDFIQLSDPGTEGALGYHHADLSIWDSGTQISVTEAFSVGSNNPLSGILSLSYELTAGTTYSYELHTYNAAEARSELNNSSPVPEPATMILFGTGLVSLAGSRLRKKKK